VSGVELWKQRLQKIVNVQVLRKNPRNVLIRKNLSNVLNGGNGNQVCESPSCNGVGLLHQASFLVRIEIENRDSCQPILATKSLKTMAQRGVFPVFFGEIWF